MWTVEQPQLLVAQGTTHSIQVTEKVYHGMGIAGDTGRSASTMHSMLPSYTGDLATKFGDLTQENCELKGYNGL